MEITDFLGQNLAVGNKVVYPAATSTSGRCLILATITGFNIRKDGHFAVLKDIKGSWCMRRNPHRVRVDKLVKVSI